jgi:hypothetical protein
LAAVAVERFRELPTSKKAKSHHGAAETRRKTRRIAKIAEIAKIAKIEKSRT